MKKSSNLVVVFLCLCVFLCYESFIRQEKVRIVYKTRVVTEVVSNEEAIEVKPTPPPPPPPPPIDDGDDKPDLQPTAIVNGKLRILSGASYCAIPALTSGRSAHEINKKILAGGFVKRWNHRMVRTGRNITKNLEHTCNGKTTCQWATETHEYLPCAPSLHIEYACDATGFVNHFKKRSGVRDLITLTCNMTSPLPKDTALELHGSRQVVYLIEKQKVAVWPISFAIPFPAYASSIKWKDTAFASLIPANTNTYKFKAAVDESEVMYNLDYKRSYFAVTRKKMGWDCLRHYEILSQGTIPYFVDIQQIPYMTMTWFPKDLVYEAMMLPGVKFNDATGSFLYHDSFSIDFDVFNKTRYFELARKIQHHVRRYQTTDFMASFILDAMVKSAKAGGVIMKRPKKILYIQHCYLGALGNMVWSGFAEMEVRGDIDKIIDIIPPKEMCIGGPSGYWAELYKHGHCKNGRKLSMTASERTLNKNEYYSWMWGWGTHRSHNEPEETIQVQDVPDKIRSRYFDAIVYGTAVKTLAWLDIVEEHYSKHEVAFVFGGDLPHSFEDFQRVMNKGQIFTRENYDIPGGYQNPEVDFIAPGIAELQYIDCCSMKDADNRFIFEDSPKAGGYEECKAPCACTTKVRYGSREKNRWASVVVPLNQTMSCEKLPRHSPHVDNVCECAKR